MMPQGRRVFITMHGIAAFVGGAVLFAIALIVAIVQVAAVARRRELLRFFPPAMGATGVALLCGVFLALGAEFQWMSGALLDNLALPVMIAALGWMFYNRMGSRRNRAALRPPPP
jgi:hypothetical protein